MNQQTHTGHNGSAHAMVPVGTIAREDGLGTELARLAETQAAATAAMVKAQVEARYKLALARPRDIDVVRTSLLKDCKRPRFAEGAMYAIKRGQKKDEATGRWVDNIIEGPSIRFAEAAIRAMTNILPESTVIFDDAEKRIVAVTVTDLETNVTYSTQVVVGKTQERKKLRDGQVALARRVNSEGKEVYIVATTDEEMLQKTNSAISRALRTLALRLLPGDILDEAIEQIETTMKNPGEDPDAQRKKLVDAFAGLNVPVGELKEYLGLTELGAASPAQLKILRGLYAAIRDGHTSWATEIAQVRTDRAEGTATGTVEGEPAKASTQADRMKEQAKAKKGAGAAKDKPDTKADAKPTEAKAASSRNAESTAKAVDPGDWSKLEVGEQWTDPKTGVVNVVFFNENLKVKGIKPVAADADPPPDADEGREPGSEG